MVQRVDYPKLHDRGSGLVREWAEAAEAFRYWEISRTAHAYFDRAVVDEAWSDFLRLDAVYMARLREVRGSAALLIAS